MHGVWCLTLEKNSCVLRPWVRQQVLVSMLVLDFGPARCSQKLVLIYNTLVLYPQWLDLSVSSKNLGEIIRFFGGERGEMMMTFCGLQNHTCLVKSIRHVFWWPSNYDSSCWSSFLRSLTTRLLGDNVDGRQLMISLTSPWSMRWDVAIFGWDVLFRCFEWQMFF